jgi:hypothetical protein
VDDLVQFLRDRLDEDEKVVRDKLCVSCGNPIVPLRSALGITRYSHGGGRANEHGEWERNWEGRRCPGSITGAEAVQNPARVRRDIDAKRHVVRECAELLDEDAPGVRTSAERMLRALAAVYRDHPDYREHWRP